MTTLMLSLASFNGLISRALAHLPRMSFSICCIGAGYVAAADMVFISVNTPTKTKGHGYGQSSGLRWVEACARTNAKAATGHTIVLEKSTLPVRIAEAI